MRISFRASTIVLAEGPATVAWRIEGTADASGRPALRSTLEGAVPLTCQRCLEISSGRSTSGRNVLLARDERELAVLDADSNAKWCWRERRWNH